jgi:hypothetical protein
MKHLLPIRLSLAHEAYRAISSRAMIKRVVAGLCARADVIRVELEKDDEPLDVLREAMALALALRTLNATASGQPCYELMREYFDLHGWGDGDHSARIPECGCESCAVLTRPVLDTKSIFGQEETDGKKEEGRRKGENAALAGVKHSS